MNEWERTAYDTFVESMEWKRWMNETPPIDSHTWHTTATSIENGWIVPIERADRLKEASHLLFTCGHWVYEDGTVEPFAYQSAPITWDVTNGEVVIEYDPLSLFSFYLPNGLRANLAGEVEQTIRQALEADEMTYEEVVQLVRSLEPFLVDEQTTPAFRAVGTFYPIDAPPLAWKRRGIPLPIGQRPDVAPWTVNTFATYDRLVIRAPRIDRETLLRQEALTSSSIVYVTSKEKRAKRLAETFPHSVYISETTNARTWMRNYLASSVPLIDERDVTERYDAFSEASERVARQRQELIEALRRDAAFDEQTNEREVERIRRARRTTLPFDYSPTDALLPKEIVARCLGGLRHPVPETSDRIVPFDRMSNEELEAINEAFQEETEAMKRASRYIDSEDETIQRALEPLPSLELKRLESELKKWVDAFEQHIATYPAQWEEALDDMFRGDGSLFDTTFTTASTYYDTLTRLASFQRIGDIFSRPNDVSYTAIQQSIHVILDRSAERKKNMLTQQWFVPKELEPHLERIERLRYNDDKIESIEQLREVMQFVELQRAYERAIELLEPFYPSDHPSLERTKTQLAMLRTMMSERIELHKQWMTILRHYPFIVALVTDFSTLEQFVRNIELRKIFVAMQYIPLRTDQWTSALKKHAAAHPHPFWQQWIERIDRRELETIEPFVEAYEKNVRASERAAQTYEAMNRVKRDAPDLYERMEQTYDSPSWDAALQRWDDWYVVKRAKRQLANEPAFHERWKTYRTLLDEMKQCERNVVDARMAFQRIQWIDTGDWTEVANETDLFRLFETIGPSLPLIVTTYEHIHRIPVETTQTLILDDIERAPLSTVYANGHVGRLITLFEDRATDEKPLLQPLAFSPYPIDRSELPAYFTQTAHALLQRPVLRDEHAASSPLEANGRYETYAWTATEAAHYGRSEESEETLVWTNPTCEAYDAMIDEWLEKEKNGERLQIVLAKERLTKPMQ
ncbi:MAG TPA: hypothetical protein VIG60_02435 [Savagea sp.]